ncbi:hypothetical protein GGI04_001683 [Coemansia thaxteri]|nr:hypothetical protein GGI04_001683 [Coemansia thaxteri]
MASLISSVAELYFAYFVPTQRNTPSLDRDAWPGLFILPIRVCIDAAAVVLLLVVRDLPQRAGIALPDESMLATEVQENAAGRHLFKDTKTKQVSPETGESVLSNGLFCWVNWFLALRDQPQLDDLYEVPSKYTPEASWARFEAHSKAGRSLGWQLAHTFKEELAVQAVLNPVFNLLDYAQPFFMQQILRFIDSYSKDQSIGIRFGLFLAVAMLAANVASTVVEQQQAWHSRLLSMKVRNIVVFLLTQKTTRRKIGSCVGNDSSEGRAYNVLASDVSRLSKLTTLVYVVVLLPYQQLLGAWYMYRLLGMAGVVGTLLLLVVMRVSQSLVARANAIEERLGALNDQRVATTSEIIRGIASVKLFGWGTRFIGVVGQKRALQVDQLWRRAKIWTVISLSTLGSLPFINYAMFAVYSMQHRLEAETIFTAIAVFMIVQRSVNWIPSLFAEAVSVVVSYRRIEAYLSEPDVEPLQGRISQDEAPGLTVGFCDASLTWDDRQFSLDKLSVLFPAGQLSLIGGPTGSGKSSMLSALIGDMTLTGGKMIVPTCEAATGQFGARADMELRDIAFVAQEPWLRNATVRDNILFGEPYEQRRYERVLRACALIPDLRVLAAGDQSEIGERGITLSGGQKQRVALARAVYSSRRILLIDDCLSAVDAQTGKHILHRCLLDNDGLMQGRTRVLITHHMAMCLPHSQFVVLLRGGRIEFQGPPSEMSGNNTFGAWTASTGSDVDIDTVGPPQDILNAQRAALAPSGQTLGRIVDDEVRLQGLIKADTWRAYFAASGGRVLVAVCLGSIVTTRLLTMYKDYYLASKLKQADRGGDALGWLGVYLGLSLASACLSTAGLLWAYAGSLQASVALHDGLLQAVVRARPRFLETTPLGRIMARFTRDVQVIDTDIMEIVFHFQQNLVSVLLVLAGITAAVPLFAVVGGGVLVVYAHVAWRFMRAQRECKRLEATAFAPLVSLYGEMIPGSASIRAFGMQQAYVAEMRRRFASYLQADFVLRSTRRWLGVRMGMTSSVVSFATAVFILLRIDSFARNGLAGLVLVYAVNFWNESVAVVRCYSDLELSLNCVERVAQYMAVDQEAAAITLLPRHASLPKDWPRTGTLRIRDLVAAHVPGVPVLHGISFTVQHGEKVGVVGRTGAGKSTLSLALLRLVEPSHGQIVLDDVDISAIGLEDLRLSVTIIPQDPVLFNGTVRFNLDPFAELPDALLLGALHRTLLLDVFAGLDDEIRENGRNLSLGQRQLVALARALVRRSRLVIMDEATASVDFGTDAIIQATIRSELADSTLLCIAHRLRSIIDYDKVLVLDHGNVVEYDTPWTLLQDKSSMFSAMCMDSGEYEHLHYIHIMRKMGVNLASQQNLQFVSALAAPVSQDLLSNLPPATRPHFVLDPDNWPAFFNWLNAQPPSLLIIDGLCSLLDQGMAADRALSFFKACQSSAAKLVVCMFADDETSVPLAHAIVRRCHHVFSFDGLVSGASTDVSGQLTVVGGHLLCQLPNEQRSFKPVVLHYKISDSSVHFFSPGQSRIVL